MSHNSDLKYMFKSRSNFCYYLIKVIGFKNVNCWVGGGLEFLPPWFN